VALSIGIVDTNSIKTRAKEFWKRNQIIFIHFPIMMAGLFGCYIALKALDPRIGVEGFGDLFGYLLNGVRATFIIFTAWWMKKWMFFDLHDDTELELWKKTFEGSPGALAARWQDRFEWVVCLAFATYWFTR
jgi:hypothetical protein